MNPADIFKNSILGTAASTLAPGLSGAYNLGKSALGAFQPKQQYLGTMQSSVQPAAQPTPVPTSSTGGNAAATTPKESFVNNQVTSTTQPQTQSTFTTPSGVTVDSRGGMVSNPNAGTQNYRNAFDLYLQSLQPTDAEQRAERYLGDLTLQSKRDQEKALASGETLGFAAGEAQRVNRNNQFGIDAASSALSALTGARTARTAAGKARLEFEQGLLPDPSKKYQTVSPGASLYDTTTGKSVFTAPTTAGLNSSIGGGGTSGIVQAVIENPALYNGLTPTQKAAVISGYQSLGLDTANLTLPNLNAEQRQKIDDYDTLEREAQYASQLLEGGLNTGPIAGNVGLAQSTLGFNQPFTQYNSAISNLAAILLRARSGAAVTPQEYERIKGFIPRVTDDETTAKTKIARFFEELQAAKQNYTTRVTQTPQQLSASNVPKALGTADDEYNAYLQAIGAQ